MSIKQLSSFTYLNVTQFLGALNDNVYKLLTVYLAIQLEGISHSSSILSTTGAIFVLPFLLFSASSGMLADRFSKRNIIVLTKAFELLIMGLGLFAFTIESKVGAYIILFMMAAQSAVFGPSKYGILPELVATEKISQANGLMTSFTFLAIILGTFLASFLVEITGRNFVIAAAFCFTIAIIGLLTSIRIEYTPPSGSHKRFSVRFLYEIYATLGIAHQQPSLLAAIFGSAYFLFLGAFVQLNMIPFAVESLNLTDVQGGYLFLITALGIGSGCYLAGKISGKVAELGLVPIAGIGITCGLYLVDFYSAHFYVVIILIFLVGILGGMFQIPLDSYIQIASPNRSRGQIVAATNFLSFFGVLLASALLYCVSTLWGIAPSKGFSIVATITLFVTIAIGFQFFDYLTRFVSTMLARLHFKIKVLGQENLETVPTIYICTHTAWNDTLLLLASQRRRMRFFIEQEKDHKPWLKKLYRLLRIVRIPAIEPFEENAQCLETMRNALSKGISVCLFVNDADITQSIARLRQSPLYSTIFEGTIYPLIPVILKKSSSKRRYLPNLLGKWRVPAQVQILPPIK